MAIPTFNPPQQASFGSGITPVPRTDTVQFHKGYEQHKPLSIIYPLQAELTWLAVEDTVREYIEGFFQQLNGTRGTFFWTPFDNVPSPTAYAPTLEQVSGGSLSSRTVIAQFTWRDSTGETKPSLQVSDTIDANNFAKVTVPVIPSGIDGFRIYATETGGTLFLQDTITTGERTWTQSAALLTSGSTAPSSNTLSVPLKWNLVGDIQKARSGPSLWDIQLTFHQQLV